MTQLDLFGLDLDQVKARNCNVYKTLIGYHVDIIVISNADGNVGCKGEFYASPVILAPRRLLLQVSTMTLVEHFTRAYNAAH